jgi:hypothetical protein
MGSGWEAGGMLMRRLALAASLGVWLLAAAAAPASAAELTGGCTLEARSFDAQGNQLDQGTAPGGAGSEGTAENPFRVAWGGRVDFHFVTGDTVFQNNTWEIFAQNIPTPILKGDDDNPMDRDELGFVTVGQDLPDYVRVVGLVFVSGNIVGNGGTARCDGSGWVQIIGDPFGTIPFYVFLALIAVGALFLIATPYTADWEEGIYTPWIGGPGQQPGGPA